MIRQIKLYFAGKLEEKLRKERGRTVREMLADGDRDFWGDYSSMYRC